MISRELRADRPVAIFFFYIRRSANELLRRIVVNEQRGGASDIGGCPIHNLVVAEFRHPRNFNTLHDAVPNCDLRIGESFAERETKRAEVDVDIALRAGIEVARQRPVARSDYQHSIDCDQESRAQDGLRPQVKSQTSETASLKSERHGSSPENPL